MNYEGTLFTKNFDKLKEDMKKISGSKKMT